MIKNITERINAEICHDTIRRLKDSELLSKYKTCESVKKAISILEDVLKKNELDSVVIEKVINDYMINLIPPGTKGVVRGNMFNKIVEDTVRNIHYQIPEQQRANYEIEFEKKHESHITSEIPDWYIYNKNTDKIIIGMNQLDVWSGGQQINRGYKYIINNPHNTEKSKLLCVVCNDIELKSEENKAYHLFRIGFEKDRLCYLKNIKNIIHRFFNIVSPSI
tara:strand:- start:7561 stop:8223 length:663 start_codon:yes stop_codon:yes gene_type:complete